MSIRVLFFGVVAERVGRAECSVEADELMTLERLVSAVKCDDFSPLLLAVNQLQVTDLSIIIVDGDEVAIMPPFSGG